MVGRGIKGANLFHSQVVGQQSVGCNRKNYFFSKAHQKRKINKKHQDYLHQSIKRTVELKKNQINKKAKLRIVVADKWVFEGKLILLND